MIDTEISRYSTIDYEQFLAYSKIIEIIINLTKIGAVHVQFDKVNFIHKIYNHNDFYRSGQISCC